MESKMHSQNQMIANGNRFQTHWNHLILIDEGPIGII
jgi:hypothetical protein